MNLERIATEGAPAAIGPYSQAIVAGGIVFCSGQLGLDPATGELADGIAAQAERALANLGEVLEAAGCTYADVAKVTVFLADIADFPTLNGVYAAFFGEPPPARSTFAVGALPKGGLVEIEAIAVRRPRGRRGCRDRAAVDTPRRSAEDFVHLMPTEPAQIRTGMPAR